MTAAIQYQTTLPENGFEWVPENEWDVRDGKKLVPYEGKPMLRCAPPWTDGAHALLLRDRPGSSKVIFPTSVDGSLFRNFSMIDPVPDRILDFANRFGSLYSGRAMTNEPFSEWQFEIRSMRFLVQLWDDVVSGRLSAKFKPYFPRVLGVMELSKDLLPLENYLPFNEKADGFSVSAVRSNSAPIIAAEAFLKRTIARCVTQHGCHFSLLGEISHCKFVMQPTSLIGAMWLQFALAISKRQRDRACEVCGHYFELSLDASRSDRRYCDNACRNKALRLRQKAARELRGAEKTPSQIAKALGID